MHAVLHVHVALFPSFHSQMSHRMVSHCFRRGCCIDILGQLQGSEDFKTFIDRHTDAVFSSQESQVTDGKPHSFAFLSSDCRFVALHVQLPTYHSWLSVSSVLHREFFDPSGLASQMPTSLTALEEFSES